MEGSARRIDLLGLLERTVDRHATKVALATREVEIRYEELGRSARSLAQRLARSGIRAGDRIALLGPAGPDWARTFFGVLDSGAIVVPLDARLEAEDLRAVLSDSAPRRVFAGAASRAKVEALVPAVPSIEAIDTLGAEPETSEGLNAPDLPRERALDDVLVLAYTSGSSGRPKGVMLSLGNLLYQVQQLTALMRTTEDDSFVSILPPNHLLELTGGLLGPLFAGARIDHASPLAPQEVIDVMRARRATVLIGVPLFFHALARLLALHAKRGTAPADALGGGVRMLISGGAPLPREVLDFFWNARIPLLEGYGLTETSPVVTLNRLEDPRFGSVGRALPGTELCIAESGEGAGEILVRGPQVMKGYWRASEPGAEAVDAESWFHTGDLGRLEADGSLWITGRLKELIVLGSGKKVQPAEVEALLATQPELAETCVVGEMRRGGALSGSVRVLAVVVPAAELAARHREPPALQAALEERVASAVRALADYKRPTRVVAHPGPLPRTPTGKIRRAQVTAWVQAEGGEP